MGKRDSGKQDSGKQDSGKKKEDARWVDWLVGVTARMDAHERLLTLLACLIATDPARLPTLRAAARAYLEGARRDGSHQEEIETYRRLVETLEHPDAPA